MIRPMLASLSAAALALTLVAAPVEARPRAGAVAAGAIIGLAAGAIIGSALADRHERRQSYVEHPDYGRTVYAEPGEYAPQPQAQPYGYGHRWRHARPGGMSPHYDW